MQKKYNKKQVGSFLLDNLLWFAGCALYALAVRMFAVPNNIAQSGLTGLSIILNHLLDTPVGLTNLVLNIPLVALAWVFIGRKFVFKTLWVTVVLSVMLDVFALFIPVYTGDRLLAALYCGVITGTGLGLVMLRGATTGGTDIVAKLFQKRWPHISVGRVILVGDVLIIVLSAVVFRSLESALYAVIVIYVSSRLIDYILYGTAMGKLLLVVTTKAEEIAAAIRQQMHRGVTILPVQDGYTQDEKKLLLCAVRPNEVAQLRRLIWEHEENPFIIIADAGEILGEGFKLPGDS